MAHSPLPRQTAESTGTQSPPHCPFAGGPHEGSPHWQQSFGPSVGVSVADGVRVGVSVSVAVDVGVGVGVRVGVCVKVLVVVGVSDGVVVGVEVRVGVRVTQRPVPSQAALKIGTQPGEHEPEVPGPQAGKGH